MRLRFRGACWDADIVATSGVPSSAQICVPPAGTQPDPVLSLKDFLQNQGVLPDGLCLPLRRLPRPLPITDLASWSCAVAIQRNGTEEDALRLGFEGSGEPGIVEDSKLLDNKHQGTQQRWPQESSQRCRQHGLAALPTPACCAVSNDPIIAIESERSFLNLVLTDQQLRGHLFSEAGMQLGAQGSPFLAAACTDYASTSGAVGAIDISHDQSLSVILERLRETRPLPGGEERCLPRVGPECASQQWFEPITEDFDELAHFPRGRIRPASGNGSWCSPEVGASETTVHTEKASAAQRCYILEPAPCSMPVSSWDALSVGHLLKQWPIPRLSELTTDCALSSLWATPAEPRAMRIKRPTTSRPSRRRGLGDDDTIVANTHQALGDLWSLGTGSRSDFMRINVDDSAGYGDLHLQTTRKGLGLLGIVGDAACGIYVATVGTATTDTIGAVQNIHSNFQPANPTPTILKQGLFPERYPQIPLAVAGATTRERERRGQQQKQRSNASSLGTHGGKADAQRTHQNTLAVLWDAIREIDTVSSSSLSSKPGAGLDFAARRTRASNLFERPASLSTEAGWNGGDESNLVTNGLLVDILASWRQSHARACLADPTTKAGPHRKSDHAPVASQLPITAPSKTPPKPTLESNRHLIVPSDGKPVLPENLPLKLGQSHSIIRGGGQPAVGVAKEPVGVAKEPVKPVGACVNMYTEAGSRGEHSLAVSTKPTQGIGVSDGEPSPCTTQGGICAVLSGQESRPFAKAAHLPDENKSVSIDDGRDVVELAVDSGRKRRRCDEPCLANPTDDVIRASPRRKSSGDGPDEATSLQADPKLATPQPGERASLPSLGLVPHRQRSMRASTGSVSTCTSFKSGFHTADGQSDVGPRFSEGIPAPSLQPANAQDGGRRHSSPRVNNGRRTVPSDKARSERQSAAGSQQAEVRASGKTSFERQSDSCSQQTGVCTSGDVTQAYQPTPTEVEAFPPRQTATASSVDHTPKFLVGDMPVVASPWMGRIKDRSSGQERPEKPRHVAPSVSMVEESNKSPIQYQGTKGTGGEDEDTAMASCGSRRQREMLALIRAGSVEGTFALTRGCQPSGHEGKGTGLMPAPVASKAPVGRSGPGGPSGVAVVPRGLTGSDSDVKSMHSGNRSVQTGRQADRPLYAVVSEELVGKEGSLVMALSTPQRRLKVGAPSNALQRVPADKASGARGSDRFAFLELPVEPPVDLVVGGRSAVVIIDSTRDQPSTKCGDGRGRDSPGTGVGVAEGVLTESEMAEAKQKLHLLTLQTLKYSTLWIIHRMGKAREGGASSRGGTLVTPAFERLEQWLVGFPCRVLIRYSSDEAQLAELITHAALAEQQLAGAITTAATASTRNGGNHRRFDPSRREATTLPGRSPLEVIEHRSRDDPDWAAVHHRQAWFLQLFPALNAYSASALLSSASLKHLIVAPFEELAPCLLGNGRGAEGGGSGGAARGGVGAESLRDFCAAVRLEEGSKVNDMTGPC